MTVAEIREIIIFNHGFVEKNFLLVYKDVTLEDEKYLMDYEINKDDELKLVMLHSSMIL
jgi:hypothetical protein